LTGGGRTNGSQVIRRMDVAWAAEQVIAVYNLVLKKRGEKPARRWR